MQFFFFKKNLQFSISLSTLSTLNFTTIWWNLFPPIRLHQIPSKTPHQIIMDVFFFLSSFVAEIEAQPQKYISFSKFPDDPIRHVSLPLTTTHTKQLLLFLFLFFSIKFPDPSLCNFECNRKKTDQKSLEEFLIFEA